MTCRSLYAILSMVFISHGWCVRSQTLPEYNMSDTTITVCQGRLFDSGGEGNPYQNNENTVTVIQTGGQISITFQNQFCLETNLDFLYVYDGVGTTGTLLGQFTGNTIPAALTAPSGAVTFVLTSDNNVAYCGFDLTWETYVPPPIPPNLSVNTSPTCGSSDVVLHFSYPIQCEWLSTAVWTVSLNGNDVPIQSVNPSCNAGQVSNVQLTLSEAFNTNCQYNVQLELGIPDACQIIHVFTIQTNFAPANCTINAYIQSNRSSVCQGQCANLSAVVNGCLSYQYQWDHGLGTGPGPKQVCPNVTTTYHVQITEIPSGVVQNFSYTLEVDSFAITTTGGTLCQSAPDITMQGVGVGEWSGDGLEFHTQIFDPDSVVGGGSTWVYYTGASCRDSVLFQIIPIQTDDITAACPGSPPFQLNATPSGGTWTGPNTTASGVFDPSTQGVYYCTYAVNGCIDSLTVNVAFISGSFQLDTICQSVWTDTISFDPLGGYWSGEGIVDSLLGVYAPSAMTPGNQTLIYHINGCIDSASVYVKEINIGNAWRSACPDQDPFVFYPGPTPLPDGGYWTGDGIINTQTGLFDPSLFPDDSYTSAIYYAPNGCTDTSFVYIRRTVIGVDSVFFCLSDPAFELNNDNMHHSPQWGGTWTGPGISNPWYDYWLFNPTLAGIGVHQLTYSINTCADSAVAVVYPNEIGPNEYSLCSNEPPFLLDSLIAGLGTWSGDGIVVPDSGLFDPSSTSGDFYLYWSNPANCRDSVLMHVIHFEPATIAGISPAYCSVDSTIQISLSPDGGVFSGDLTSPSFNPANLAPNTYHVYYVYTNGSCASQDSASFVVTPPLILNLSVVDSILCKGSGTTISADASGGLGPAAFLYNWSNGALSVNSIQVNPAVSSWFSVELDDGCSPRQSDSVFITVLPPVEPQVLLSDTVCFGEPAVLDVQLEPIANYEIKWDTTITQTLQTTAGSSHQLHILDLVNGCSFDSVVTVPSFPPVTANFSVNPNASCLTSKEAQNVQFIDYSLNAVSGIWDFGNGQTLEYGLPVVPQTSYGGAGYFTVTLIVNNNGGCADTATAVVCVLPPTPVFIPEAFSPNGDGNNDIFMVRGSGIISLECSIYNRWGQRVFKSTRPEDGWDGSVLGQPALPGNYLYEIKIRLNDGTQLDKRGEIALVR